MSDLLNTPRREQILAICQSLIQIQSLSGQEKAVSERVVEWMSQLGYQHIHVDERGNVVGILYGTADKPVTMYDSHVDTVAAQDDSAWRFGAFSGHVAEDRIWGRGSSDMKGALAACMAGLAYAKQDGKLQGTAIVSASVGEEVIEGLAFSSVVNAYKPDLVIICESTGLRLNIAGRGRAEVTVTVHGKSAHASTPHLGVNALRQMARLVLALDEIEPPVDRLLGKGILEPTEIITSPYPCVSVVPWACRARYDRRMLAGETEADALDSINAVIAHLSAADPTFQAEAAIDEGEFTCYTGLTLHQKKFQPAWRFSPEEPFVKTVQGALRRAGQAAEFGHYGFCTNGSHTAGRAEIPTLGYGPGFEETAHTTDEYLDLDQLFGAAEGYYAIGEADF